MKLVLGIHLCLNHLDSDYCITIYVNVTSAPSASTVRHLYLRGGAGVGSMTKIYGSRQRNGVCPAHYSVGSKNVARKVLQALELLKMIEKDPNGLVSHMLYPSGLDSAMLVAKLLKLICLTMCTTCARFLSVLTPICTGKSDFMYKLVNAWCDLCAIFIEIYTHKLSCIVHNLHLCFNPCRAKMCDLLIYVMQSNCRS